MLMPSRFWVCLGSQFSDSQWLFVCLSMFNAVRLCLQIYVTCEFTTMCFADIEQLIFVHFNPKTRLACYLVPKVALHLTNN